MISIVIPTWMRFLMVIECFEKVLQDIRVDEVIISDDCSTDGSYERLREHFKYNHKVKVFQNEFNLGCHLNKRKAVELASNCWVVIADSDNIFSTDYLDTIFNYTWDKDIILTPEFAAPNFNFEAYAGLLINQHNIAEYIDKPMFEVMCNACNYFVNKESYLEVHDDTFDPFTSDSIYTVYRWLKSGRSIFVTPNLMYEHRVHSGSHYQNNLHKTPKGFHQLILNNLKELK